MSTYKSFPVKFGVFEVQQESQSQSRDPQVVNHLRLMGIIETSHDLGVGNHDSIPDESNRFA